MELLAIAAIIAIAAFAGGKKKADASFEERPDKRETKVLPLDKKWAGNPPNMSQDAEGYNTQRWPDSQTVCAGMGALGYVPYAPGCNDENLKSNTQFSKGVVKKFQGDYNKIARIPGWGGIKGTLAVDGIVGANTLNAMEHAELLGVPWQAVVEGYPPPGA